MAQIAKAVSQTEIRCSPDKVYGFFKNNIRQLTRTHPDVFKSAQLLQGQDNCVGSVVLWKYVIGTAMSAKVKTETINEQNRSITFKVIEGDIMQLYKSVKVIIQISQGFANWTFEYEKAFEGAPGMDDYANVTKMVSKSLDAYLLTH